MPGGRRELPDIRDLDRGARRRRLPTPARLLGIAIVLLGAAALVLVAQAVHTSHPARLEWSRDILAAACLAVPIAIWTGVAVRGRDVGMLPMLAVISAPVAALVAETWWQLVM